MGFHWQITGGLLTACILGLAACGGASSSGDPISPDVFIHPDSGDPGGGDPGGGTIIVVTDSGREDVGAGDPGTTDSNVDPGPSDPGVEPDDTQAADDGPDTGITLVCSPRTRFVYVVTDTREFLKFDPPTGTFTLLGSLDCPNSSFMDPFSMAIDRKANAWVLYNNGNLYKVSTLDASCEATAFVPNQSGFDQFGMGFSSDQPGSTTETLFVSELVDGGSARLGSIAFPSLALSPVGSAISAGSAELTGNGLAELWGFFPQSSPPVVARIDKATAALLAHYTIPASVFSGDVTAWAFAFWGGSFYIFVAVGGSNSIVARLDPVTSEWKTVTADAGYAIVGAGVSSCAPFKNE